MILDDSCYYLLVLISWCMHKKLDKLVSYYLETIRVPNSKTKPVHVHQ